MAKTIDKLADLEYNELVTLRVIEMDDMSTSILREDLHQPFLILYKLSKEGILTDKDKEIIKAIFDYGICTNKILIDKYLRILNGGDESIETTVPVEVKVKDEMAVKIVKNSIYGVFKGEFKTDKKKLPRRYGRDMVVKDIQAQGGKATNVQLAALATNKLKNIYINLNTRLIKDMLSDTKILSDEDYREIRATITIVERKLESILKRKK
jgi:hypothetical protein